MMPWPGLLEPFTECLGLGIIGALCTNYLFNVSIPLFLVLHMVVWFCCDLMLIKTIEVSNCIVNYSMQQLSVLSVFMLNMSCDNVMMCE